MHNSVKKVNRNKIRWRDPLSHYCKLNFIGASKGNPGISGIGCVIRNHEGKFIKAGKERIQDGTNNIFEAQALLFGDKIEKREKIQHLVIEGDP